MVVCAAHGCNSKQGKDSTTFFCFPYENSGRRKWTDNINRFCCKRTKPFVAKLASKLCSLHFTDDRFVVSPSVLKSVGFLHKKRLQLKKGAIPTVFRDIGQSSVSPTWKKESTLVPVVRVYL